MKFVVSREFRLKCAPRVKYPPILYTRFSVYSTRSLCTRPDLFIKQWALHFALPASSTKDTLVFVCEFPSHFDDHWNLLIVISFIPFHYTLSQSVSKMHPNFSFNLILATSSYCRLPQKNYRCELGRHWLAS